MEIKVLYKDISGFEFSQVLTKIANVATDTMKALHIRHIIDEIQTLREKVSQEYKKELMEVFAKKDENGKPLFDERSNGEDFSPDETRTDEFLKAQDDFGKREGLVNYRALTPHTLADVKLSAKELKLLGPLFTEENGPGLPAQAFSSVQSVHPLRQ